MQIHKVTYPSDVLLALPKPQLSAFLLLGHFLNEANWLQKLLLIASQEDSGGEAEDKARLVLALMVTKLLAAKIHEGWIRLANGQLAAALGALSLTPMDQNLEARLTQRLGKDSLLHKLRRQAAAHYPTSLSLDGLPNISQSDVSLFMTRHAGDTLSVIAELSAAADLMALVPATTIVEALDVIVKEVVEVSGLYIDYLQRMLAVLAANVIAADPTSEIAHESKAPFPEAVRLPFFMSFPTNTPGREP